jgi:hypothetical protein
MVNEPALTCALISSSFRRRCSAARSACVLIDTWYRASRRRRRALPRNAAPAARKHRPGGRSGLTASIPPIRIASCAKET